ncbi:MAG: UDP-N-acetylmuramoyl-tripeptide--D-alanyl-D-alanine ligase [Planctomycetota bacterium]|nr:UDP-N-acetylmuramoyl-tripeptide--D-alanyl-D-alanine ligase [Planctomycetota bacterium]
MSGRAGLGSWMTPTAVKKAVQGELHRRGRSVGGVVTDSRQETAGQLFVALTGPNHDGHDHVVAAIERGARGVLIERSVDAVPGLDRATGAFIVQVDNCREALLRLAAEHRRRCAARVIGITGSCGKTTVKEWLGGVLATSMPTVRSPASFNNDIGVPITLFQMDAATRAAVVEIGTNAPGEIGTLSAVAQPDVAIVTCVAAAHLRGLGSVEGVAKEKAQLPAALSDAGLCILNGDDASCRAMVEMTAARVQLVAIDREADWFATDLQFHPFGTSFRLQGERPVTLPRLGTHNVYNALFVLAAAAEMGVPEEDALQALAELPIAARRLEPKRFAGITLFDDTYNMNPGSARAGLQAVAGVPVPGRRIVVFGEMLELGEQSLALHEQLGADVHRAEIDELVTVGTGAQPIADGAITAGMSAKSVHRLSGIEDARQLLAGMLREGDQVLCKASRGVRLDRLVDDLATSMGAEEGGR